MFDTRIFNPERLGSEEEEKSLQYTGFTILAHVNAENSAQAIQWAKCTFSSGGYEFDEKDNRYFIHYNSCDSPIEVIPQKIKYKDAYDPKAQTFNLIFQSDIFGYKWHEESYHQKLCHNLLSKIRKKRAFWVKGGKRFPIPRTPRLTRPKRH